MAKWVCTVLWDNVYEGRDRLGRVSGMATVGADKFKGKVEEDLTLAVRA